LLVRERLSLPCEEFHFALAGTERACQREGVTETFITAPRARSATRWTVAFALLPALAVGAVLYGTTAMGATPTTMAGAVVSDRVELTAAVVAPGAVADYDAKADVPKIEIILPPPPPPPSTGRRTVRNAQAAAAAAATGDWVGFCSAGGGQSAEAWSLDGLLAAANAERARFGIRPLSWSGSLASASQGWANQLVANDNATPYAHDAIAHNPNRPRGGENVAMSYRASGLEQGSAVNRAHIGWMRSNGHCQNLLNPKWSVMGAGTAVTSDGTTWYTVANYQ
jgi:uncharacterized protein YkwD